MSILLKDLYIKFSGIMLHEMLLGRPPFDVACGPGTSQLEYEDLLFREILEKPVNIPRYVSAAATDAITGFLEKNPDDRLGCDCDGFYEISCHDFFRGIDWGLVSRRLFNNLSNPCKFLY